MEITWKRNNMESKTNEKKKIKSKTIFKMGWKNSNN